MRISKLWIFAVFSAGIALFSTWIFCVELIRPELGKARPMKAEVLKAEDGLREVQGKLGRDGQAPSATSEVQNLEALRERSFKTLEDMLSREALDSILSQDGAALGLPSLEKPAASLVSEERYGAFTRSLVRIVVRADYRDLVRYLEKLEEVSPGLRVRSFKVSRADGSRALEEAQIEIEAFLKDRSDPKAPAPKLDSRSDQEGRLRRDPFTFVLREKSKTSSNPDFKLNALIFRGPDIYAVINGRLLRSRDWISKDTWVETITPDGVKLFHEKRNLELAL